MTSERQAEWFLSKIGLQPIPLIQPLERLPFADLESFNPSNHDAARALLVQQRVSGADYKPPSQQKRNYFRTKKQKESICNVINWTFTKHEVASAFDCLLCTAPLAPVGVAQALLAEAPGTTVGELWCHFKDPKLEKKATKNREATDIQPFLGELTWLDKVTILNKPDYIDLLCQGHLKQETLDRAFGFALAKHSLEAMRTLLYSGAVVTRYEAAIKEHVANDNVLLVKLLLSAPMSMSTAAWRSCLAQLITAPGSSRHALTILQMCLANRRDIFSEPLLLGALQSQNIEALTILLAYGGPRENFAGMKERACQLACLIDNDMRRLSVFNLLFDAGLMANFEGLRAELLKDVKAGNLLLAKVLVQARVQVDVAVGWAVSQLDFRALELLRNGYFSSAVSLSLTHLPDTATEEQIIRLMDLLSPLGVASHLLDSFLVKAVRGKQTRLVQALLTSGASVETENAAAIHAALNHPDLEMLEKLLKYTCSPKVLSKVVPRAMMLTPRPVRMTAMTALVEKGVEASALGTSLRELVAEVGEIDEDLIKLLLKHKAPVESISDPARNPILVVAYGGNISVLRMLCDAGPLKQTLAAAVPVAYSSIGHVEYPVVADIIKLLIEKGASGQMLDGTLRDATLTDSTLDIVQILLDGRADCNFDNGAAFVHALKTGNLKLLELLCTKSQPNYTTLQTALPTALQVWHYDLKAVELLLRCPGAEWVLNSLWSMEMLVDHPNRSEIIPLFLQCGLSVNADTGSLLRIAIRDKNVDLIKEILTHSPNVSSLHSGFQEAINLNAREGRLPIMRLLLESSSSAEIGQSQYLIQETAAALVGDLAGLRLLLSHNATVEVSGGKALVDAATAGSSTVLDMLLSTGPSASVVEKAFTATSSSELSADAKLGIFTCLLNVAGAVDPATMAKVLADYIANHPKDRKVPELFICHGVTVTFNLLKKSFHSSPEAFEILTRRLHSPTTANKIFKHIRKAKLNPEKRHWAYKCLYKKGADQKELSLALVDSVKTDASNLEAIELLVQQGADAGYKKGIAFTTAFREKQDHTLAYLSRTLIEESGKEAANIAFDLVRKTTTYDPNTRLEVYESLVKFDLNEDLLYQALVDALEDGQRNISTVRLLLEKGADPNKLDAQCFVMAYGKWSKVVFQTLAKYADFQVVFPVLLKKIHAEDDAVRCIRTCLAEQTDAAVNLPDELLFDCLRKFPGGTRLLKLLLDMGLSPLATIDCALHRDWKPEQCTALIWALASQPKVGNDVLLYLLQRGEEELATYATPRKKITAMFCCLMDKNRTPVLRALLNIDSPEILESTISGSTFSGLATPAVKPKQDFDALFEDADEISPREACLFLGNFQAFRLMQGGQTPDDGTLHLASLLALPEFVKYLLDTHDPSYAAEDFGFMIPLGLACCSKPFPWCKVANEGKAWEKRLRETMKLLIPRSEFDWRHRERLTLHIALENGLEVTKALVEALGGVYDSKADRNYVYVDKTGMKYSPVAYVEAFLEAEGKEKTELVKYLNEQSIC